MSFVNETLRYVGADGNCVRTSIQQAIGGYRSDLPHTADVEMWMRFAVHSDIAYVRGVDQALYRIHTSNMTIERVPIIDLKQRKAAYDAIFSAYGDIIPDADELHKAVTRKMAREALWLACSAYHRRHLNVVPVEELVSFALSAYPDAEGCRNMGLRWRQLSWPDHFFLPSADSCFPLCTARLTIGCGGKHGGCEVFSPNTVHFTSVTAATVLHGSAGGRSGPILACVQAMRTDFGRPSSSMRFRTATATLISVA